jgi:hypothetical protein
VGLPVEAVERAEEGREVEREEEGRRDAVELVRVLRID